MVTVRPNAMRLCTECLMQCLATEVVIGGAVLLVGFSSGIPLWGSLLVRTKRRSPLLRHLWENRLSKCSMELGAWIGTQ